MSAPRQLETFPNLVAMFFARAGEKGDSPFLWAKKEGAWRPISWREAANQVCSLAAGGTVCAWAAFAASKAAIAAPVIIIAVI